MVSKIDRYWDQLYNQSSGSSNKKFKKKTKPRKTGKALLAEAERALNNYLPGDENPF